MTDKNNHPVDEQLPEVVEPQNLEPRQKTVEDLEEEIQKLAGNRDQILTEKRAVKEARDKVDSELMETKNKLAEATERYDALLLKTTKAALLARINPVDGCEDFFTAELNRLVTVSDGDAVLTDEDGNLVDCDKFLEVYTDKYARFMKVPTASGCSALGGSRGGAARGTPKNKPSNQFGLK
ncbi:hypothetical protein [Vibrio sp. 10N.286.48.F5]|uniref:hypothetical protein n=1 Tax=Vibrio sp. 10N.286.48.F5 TaxID=3229699 RepID=UPI00354E2CBE